jgi:hypothetical protein
MIWAGFMTGGMPTYLSDGCREVDARLMMSDDVNVEEAGTWLLDECE